MRAVMMALQSVFSGDTYLGRSRGWSCCLRISRRSSACGEESLQALHQKSLIRLGAALLHMMHHCSGMAA